MAYYTPGTPATANTLARAENIAAELVTIAAAFDKVPEQLSLEQGRAVFAQDTGAANAYVIALPATPAAYTTGLTIIMKAVNVNTGASTVNVDSLGVKSIKRFNGDALIAGDIPAGGMVGLHYDGTNFQIAMGTLSVTSTVAVADGGTGATTASGARTNLGLGTAAVVDTGITSGLIPTLNADGGITMTDTGADATEGPIIDLFRSSASPAADDAIGAVRFSGRDDAAAYEVYGDIRGSILDPAAASTDFGFKFIARVANTLTELMNLGPGAQIGAPTGGDKGVGTINIENGIYSDGTIVADMHGLVLLASASPSAAASVDITSAITSAYDTYLLVFNNLIPATDDVILWMRTSTDNGSTFDSGAADYAFAVEGLLIGSGASTSISNSDNQEVRIELSDDTATQAVGNGATEGISGHVWIYSPLSATVNTRVFSQVVYGAAEGHSAYLTGVGERAAAADVDAAQLLFSSGNIASGEVRFYGVRDT